MYTKYLDMVLEAPLELLISILPKSFLDAIH